MDVVEWYGMKAMRGKSAAGWTWQAGLVDNVPLSTTKVVTRSLVHNVPEIQGIDELTTTKVNTSCFNEHI